MKDIILNKNKTKTKNYYRLHSFEIAMLMNLNPRTVQEAIVLIPSLGKQCLIPNKHPIIREALTEEEIESLLKILRSHSLKMLSGGL